MKGVVSPIIGFLYIFVALYLNFKILEAIGAEDFLWFLYWFAVILLILFIIASSIEEALEEVGG